MDEKVIVQGSEREFDERVEKWHHSDIMVPSQSYLCLTDNEWHAFLNGNVIFSDDLESKKL